MIVEVKNLTKVYQSNLKKIVALDDISFTQSKGRVLGILGPNGAGKTTLLKIITGITNPTNTEAQIKILGQEDISKVKKDIGFLPENPQFLKNIKAKELLEFSVKVTGRKASNTHINQILEYVSLQKEANKKIKYFSKGMIQRIGFAQAIINAPKLLILDEPFEGIDPPGRKKFIQLIRKNQKEGKTVIFSTHNLKDIEEICNDIIILKKGRIVLNTEMEEYKREAGYKIHVRKKDQKQEIVTAKNKEQLWGIIDEIRILDSTILKIYTDIAQKLEGYFDEEN